MLAQLSGGRVLAQQSGGRVLAQLSALWPCASTAVLSALWPCASTAVCQAGGYGLAQPSVRLVAVG